MAATEKRQRRLEQTERDREIEQRYMYHKDWHEQHRDVSQSTDAYVSVHRDDLAEEFYKSLGPRDLDASGGIESDLRFWEVKRFGNELHHSAHGMLLYAVKRKAEHGRRFVDPHWDSRSQQDAFESAAYLLEPVRKPAEPGFAKGRVQIEPTVHLLLAEAGVKVESVVTKPMPDDDLESKVAHTHEMDPMPENRMPYKDPPDDAPTLASGRSREPGEDDEPDWLEGEL